MTLQIVSYPLTKANRIKLAHAFGAVPKIDISVACVVEGQMGQAFVDNLEKPTVYRIQVAVFHYLSGDPNSPAADAMLDAIFDCNPPIVFFMSMSPGWSDVIKSKYGEKLTTMPRFTFSSENISLDHLDYLIANSTHEVTQMDLKFAQSIYGKEVDLDINDFDSAQDFIDRSVGFYIMKDGQMVGYAYGSLACSEGIEVSIYIEENYRRLGMATTLGAHLVRWAHERNARANWDAANKPSCGLAEKLGYTFVSEYQAYYTFPK